MATICPDTREVEHVSAMSVLRVVGLMPAVPHRKHEPCQEFPRPCAAAATTLLPVAGHGKKGWEPVI